jgi:hypothetical protein
VEFILREAIKRRGVTVSETSAKAADEPSDGESAKD